MKRSEHFAIRICITLTVAALSLIVGCGGDSTTQPVSEAPTPIHLQEFYGAGDTTVTGVDTIIACDSTIAVSIIEGYLQYGLIGEPVLCVRLETDRIYHGYNFSILNTVETRPGGISFINEGIVIPQLIQDALGPARVHSFFEAPVGTYKLSFTNGDLTDVYSVKIGDTSITIDPSTESVTRPTHRVYWRYPPRSFALYCGTLVESSYLCDEIVDSLLAHLDLEEFYFPDSGEAAYRRTSMGHYYDAPARFFRYQEESDFAVAGAILEQFVLSRQAEFSGVGISFVNWRQERYMSWMMLE